MTNRMLTQETIFFRKWVRSDRGNTSRGSTSDPRLSRLRMFLAPAKHPGMRREGYLEFLRCFAKVAKLFRPTYHCIGIVGWKNESRHVLCFRKTTEACNDKKLKPQSCNTVTLHLESSAQGLHD